MTAISVSERLLEMAAFYTPLALTVTNMCRAIHMGSGVLSHDKGLAVVSIMSMGDCWVNNNLRMCRPLWHIMFNRW